MVKGIRQLARHLDISIGTVSRALNGKNDVSEHTRQRVLEAATRLDYSANQAARALRRGTTGLVGVVIPSFQDDSALGNPLFSTALQGIETVLSRHDIDLIGLISAPDDDAIFSVKRFLAKRLVDGVIFLSNSAFDARHIVSLDRHRIPYVVYGPAPADAAAPGIEFDFQIAAEGNRCSTPTLPFMA